MTPHEPLGQLQQFQLLAPPRPPLPALSKRSSGWAGDGQGGEGRQPMLLKVWPNYELLGAPSFAPVLRPAV